MDVLERLDDTLTAACEPLLDLSTWLAVDLWPGHDAATCALLLAGAVGAYLLDERIERRPGLVWRVAEWPVFFVALFLAAVAGVRLWTAAAEAGWTDVVRDGEIDVSFPIGYAAVLAVLYVGHAAGRALLARRRGADPAVVKGEFKEVRDRVLTVAALAVVAWLL